MEKEIELKSLYTQLSLQKDIISADNMVLHCIRNEAGALLRKIIEPKMFFKDKQTTVELTTDEFTDIRLLLAYLDPKTNSLDKIDKGFISRYLEEKKIKQDILSQLQ